MEHKHYITPIIASQTSTHSIVPLAALAALSAAEAAAIASAAGIGLGLAMGNNKGRSDALNLGRKSSLQECSCSILS